MKKEEIKVRCYDDFYLNAYIFGNYEENFKGIVQIAHGKGEHSGNYGNIIKRLLENSYIVVIHDHRGHGKYNKGKEFFESNTKDNNFEVMVKDLRAINYSIRQKFPDKKVFLLGHSMGGYLSLKYAEVYGDTIDGLVLSGIGRDNKINLFLPVLVTKFICGFSDANKPNKFVSKNFFRVLNRKFKNDKVKHDYAFTTSDKIVLDRYNSDDLRIKQYTLKFYHDLFNGLYSSLDSKSISKIPKNLKIFIVAGEDDPVSSFERGVSNLNSIFINNKIDSRYKIYKNMRHEVFVEKDRDKVIYDVLEFLKSLN